MKKMKKTKMTKTKKKISNIWRISRQFEISAAHHLENYKGECKNLHGHNYIIEVFLEGKKLVNGMLKDYKDIEKDFELIQSTFDHSNLNDYMNQPTAENIAEFVLRNLRSKDKRYYKVSVRETGNSYCEVEITKRQG